MSVVSYVVEDHIAIITLNRPEARNALNPEVACRLADAWASVRDDDEVRVAILTGTGSAFCAGAKPIIAAINGSAAGLGLIMALYADIRIAAAGAKFTTAFSRRGLVAEHGISWLLPRLIGFAAAADLLYSARVFTAEEALQLRLVNRVIPKEDFAAEVAAYAKMLATEVSPRSLREMKREIWNAQFQSLGDAIDSANADMPPSFRSEDFKEGVAHFVEKRAPKFTGR